MESDALRRSLRRGFSGVILNLPIHHEIRLRDALRQLEDREMIYFIECGLIGPIKIGYTSNPKARLKALQAASPYPLRLLGVIEGDHQDERAIQSRLEHHRMRGEWFYGTVEVDYVVQGILKKQGLDYCIYDDD